MFERDIWSYWDDHRRGLERGNPERRRASEREDMENLERLADLLLEEIEERKRKKRREQRGYAGKTKAGWS